MNKCPHCGEEIFEFDEHYEFSRWLCRPVKAAEKVPAQTIQDGREVVQTMGESLPGVCSGIVQIGTGLRIP